MIVVDAINRYFVVSECQDPALAHCWNGYAVKHDAGKWKFKSSPETKPRSLLLAKTLHKVVSEAEAEW